VIVVFSFSFIFSDEMARNPDRRRKDHYVDFYSCSLGYQQGDSCKRKKRGRIRYLNWAVDRSGMSGIFQDGFNLDDRQDQEKIKKDKELEKQVRQALGKLDETERKFILYFYFDCFSYKEIGFLLKKRKDKLQRIHQSALDKLKLILKDYVEKRFEFRTNDDTGCIICQNPHRKKLDRIIRGKRKEETWKRVIKILRNGYDLRIKTPQILIGHLKKHMVDRVEGRE
jgi:RNA polymerase sigma factor (sigma-70 family)